MACKVDAGRCAVSGRRHVFIGILNGRSLYQKLRESQASELGHFDKWSLLRPLALFSSLSPSRLFGGGFFAGFARFAGGDFGVNLAAIFAIRKAPRLPPFDVCLGGGDGLAVNFEPIDELFVIFRLLRRPCRLASLLASDDVYKPCVAPWHIVFVVRPGL